MTNQWISFKDQQPPMGAKVLVYGNPYPIKSTYKGIYIADVVYIYGPKILTQFNTNGDDKDYLATAPRDFDVFSHWMLLPEAP
jgi:hypothetical protein